MYVRQMYNKNNVCQMLYRLDDIIDDMVDVYQNRLVQQMFYVDDRMYVRCLLYAGQMV